MKSVVISSIDLFILWRFLFVIVLWLFVMGVNSSAAQSECGKDSDCESGQLCHFSQLNCTVSESAKPGEDPPEPECEPATPGICVTDCQQDSDCEQGYFCDKTQMLVQLPCRDGQECSNPTKTDSQPGICSPALIDCASDDQCPSPLVCELNGCSPSSDIKSREECGDVKSGECVYIITECASDADCGGLYECVIADEKCDVSVQPSTVECDASDDCVEDERDTYSEVCEKHERRICFPKEIGCKSDDDCDNNWRCYDFSKTQLLESVDGYKGPPWWNTGQGGIAVACMPEGLIAMFDGRAEVRSGDGNDGSAASGQNDSAKRADTGSDSFAVRKADETEDSSEQEDKDSREEDDSGDCAVALHQKKHPTWMFLWIAIFALRFARYR